MQQLKDSGDYMAIQTTPEVETPPTRTSPKRSGGWFRRLQHRVRLAMAGDDEELMLENRTEIPWRVYHDYHQLGIIDAGEYQIYRLAKRGSLNVRPVADSDEVEYLVLSLNEHVRFVRIYRRQMGEEVEVYDMRAA
jgi:hypothetical protein